jgi:hypothetical protein
MPAEDVGKKTVATLNAEYNLVYTQNRIIDTNEYQIKATIKRVHELS